ncbi:lanthionine synthetase LanC family protein [Chryseobacterium phocaeense]|uniref:lanthionine synthetase LanC family protein n=1 Tax=Chryseobacterium phocaeense TaxID=1816690 RepID=UPI0009B99D50|nr:lanthionine synthetase LanC family protein [Chryseobacterium phocaeense]
MKAEEYYHTLKNHLRKNGHAFPGTGLNGRCAIVIFMFEYYRISSDTEAYNYGIELLEAELNEIDLITNISLYDGLCGIGWAVQYLSKENMIDLDADTYLPQYIEKHLEKFRDSQINFTHPIQLEYLSDLLFYFATRFSFTRRKLQKKKYSNILNQNFIILHNQFLQIEKYHSLQHLSFENIFPVVRACVYAYEIGFKSALVPVLLRKALSWLKDLKTQKKQTVFEQYILKKATKYASSSKHTAGNYTIKSKIPENNAETEQHITGIWNTSITHNLIQNMIALNPEKDLGLEYILEYQYNS